MHRFLTLISNIAADLFHLVYPNICQSCGKQLVTGERVICLFCQVRLPQTEFHADPDNPVARHFWGRAEIQRATSFYYFSKGGSVQQLMYKLKYKGRRDIGIRLGELYGGVLKENKLFADVDLIVPVPLHIARQRVRGYNQSDLIAEGMSRVMQIPWSGQCLGRTTDNVSQTGKSRIRRWENVEGIFKVKRPAIIENRHILLVDDVITTGSTLEATATAILAVPGTKVSIATIACAT